MLFDVENAKPTRVADVYSSSDIAVLSVNQKLLAYDIDGLGSGSGQEWEFKLNLDSLISMGLCKGSAAETLSFYKLLMNEWMRIKCI